jgi:hypothetical protein
MRVNSKIIQLIADAAIPLMGYFLWNWDLYFIVLFYLIDYLSNEVFLHVKSNKIVQYSGKGRESWIGKGLVSGLFFLGVIALTHLAIQQIIPEIDFKAELIKFWTYKDMGIEQGYILVPLIVLVGYQRYRMEFVLPAKERVYTIDKLWRGHFIAQFVLIGCCGLAIGLSAIVSMPQVVYILGIVLIVGVFQIFNSGRV